MAGLSTMLNSQRNVANDFRRLTPDHTREERSPLMQVLMPRELVQNSDLVDPAEKYSRQPRHKTRTNKYDYKAEDVRQDRASTYRGRKRKRPVAVLDPGDCFEAPNVKTRRVSLKPKFDLGIFSKSKTSVPLAGRDLPDLTFMSMDFLSKDSKETAAITTRIEVPHPNDRETKTRRLHLDRFRSDSHEYQPTNTQLPIRDQRCASDLLNMYQYTPFNAANDSPVKFRVQDHLAEQRPL